MNQEHSSVPDHIFNRPIVGITALIVLRPYALVYTKPLLLARYPPIFPDSSMPRMSSVASPNTKSACSAVTNRKYLTP